MEVDLLLVLMVFRLNNKNKENASFYFAINDFR